MTEEEVFGFYFIAGYTVNRMLDGISMEEAEEDGLLNKKFTDDSALPF